ncbi:MAG TPA: ABC transporter substrate-binding protein [Candidatus Binatia bacterium]
MKRICGLLLALLPPFLAAAPAAAQKVVRIGALAAEEQFIPAIDGFKKKMAELGYAEGKNVVYDLRNARGDQDALAKMAEALVQQKPDLIVTSSTSATVLVAKATAGGGIPVVFLSAGDPLRVVKSYASSGNNLTGVSTAALDLTGKRIELLKKLAPGIKRLIVLLDSKGMNHERTLKTTEEEAAKLGLEASVLDIEARNVEEIRQKASLIKRSLGDALLVPPDATMVAATETIAQQAIKERLPQVGPNLETVKRGLLAAYAPNFFSLGQQGALLVDKILKGARPTDLPIEQPYKLYLMINLKTAQAIGLKVSRELLLLADEVIQ